jgi:hypothetical protein
MSFYLWPMTLSLLGWALLIELYGRSQGENHLSSDLRIGDDVMSHELHKAEPIGRNALYFLLACPNTTESTELG